VSETNATTRLTVEEIEGALSEIARNGEPPDKFRALALLRKEQPASATGVLPEPLTDAERVDMLAPLLEAVGPMLARVATNQAFGRRQPAAAKLKAQIEQLPGEIREKIKRITSLPTLYKACPELKKPGRPLGYPAAGGPLAKRAFAQRLATEYHLELLNGSAAPGDVSDRDSRYRAALEDLRAVIGTSNHVGPWLSSSRDVLEPLLAAVDSLLANPAAVYPPGSASGRSKGVAPAEPAPPRPA
jgi:hypothetical protein